MSSVVGAYSYGVPHDQWIERNTVHVLDWDAVGPCTVDFNHLDLRCVCRSCSADDAVPPGSLLDSVERLMEVCSDFASYVPWLDREGDPSARDLFQARLSDVEDRLCQVLDATPEELSTLLELSAALGIRDAHRALLRCAGVLDPAET